MIGATSFLPVLTFHTLDNQGGVTSFSPELFRRSLSLLAAKGYRTLTLREATASLRQGQFLPARTLVLTFDDGCQSVYTEAFPALKEHGMLATVFLTVGEKNGHIDERPLPLDGRTLLSWQEIREMHEEGLEFGAHTLTHPDLTRLTPEQAATEIVGSQEVISARLATPVTSFAYPFGRYNHQVREIVRRHFLCACSDALGLVKSECDLYTLPRVDTYYLRTERLFQLLFSGVFPWYLRWRDLPRRLRRAWRERGCY